MYRINPDISFMKPSDRSLYFLNRYQIPYTMNEFYAIKLSKGLFDKTNESYLINFSKDINIKTHIHIILDHAIMMSTSIHNMNDIYKNKSKEVLSQGKKWGRPKKIEKIENIDENNTKSIDSKNGSIFDDDVFNDLFSNETE